jgi:hypothetical protein
MKLIVNAFTLLFLINVISLQAQSVITNLSAEKNVKGCSYRGALGYEFSRPWAIGGFYELTSPTTFQEEKKLVDPFYGVYVQTPLVSSERILVSAVLRAGFINKNFFVITPAVETRIRVFSQTFIVFGAGLRHGYTSASIGIGHKLLTF